MSNAHGGQLMKHGGTEVAKFATAILSNSAVFLACSVAITVKAREDLIDQYFSIRCHVLVFPC